MGKKLATEGTENTEIQLKATADFGSPLPRG